MPGKVMVCCLVVETVMHDRVVNGHKILHSHALAVHRSIIVVRPTQAFHDEVCECRLVLAIFATVVYRTCAEAGSRRGVFDTTRRHQLLVSLKDFGCKGIHWCGRCPVSMGLSIS